MEDNEQCAFCGSHENLTKHHLIPQRVSRSNKYPKKLKTEDSNLLTVCEDCHRTIHAYFDERELRDVYCSKDALMSNEKFMSYVEWKIKHPGKSSPAKMSNTRKGKR